MTYHVGLASLACRPWRLPPARRRESLYSEMSWLGRMGRLVLPLPMLAYPFYLWQRSPGKTGSHFNPKTDLFTEAEGPMVSSQLPAIKIMKFLGLFS